MTRLGCLGLCLIFAVGLPANTAIVSAASGNETIHVTVIDCPPWVPYWWCS